MQNVIDYFFNLDGVDFRIEGGNLGFLSHVAFLVTYGETSVFITVNLGESISQIDFVPLTVEYVEKLYAGGIISSSPYVKREGKPTEREILNARLVDHAIRSLFPSNFNKEIQLIIQVFSYDERNDPVLAGMIGAGFALMYAGIPFKGPYGVTKVGYIDNEIKLNPNLNEIENSLMEMFVSSNEVGIVSIEGEIHNLSRNIIKEAIQKAFEHNYLLINKQYDFINKYGTKAYELSSTDNSEGGESSLYEAKLEEMIRDMFIEDMREALFGKKTKVERNKAVNNLIESILAKLKSNSEDFANLGSELLKKVVDKLSKEIARKRILHEKVRIDGRGVLELRPLDVRVGVLPRVHGSAIFQRGETQSLTTVTLGTDEDELQLQSLEGSIFKRYFHHYNMPGYATGEIDRKFGFPSRRSIGHGAIGEKALKNLLPSEEVFPYTIRVVSEILSSDGSTSMAATCGSSLALMDAGVPISEHVGGIGMGLIFENNDSYVILSDIAGVEDHYGDMDFKITGTYNGITAIQLDNKIAGIPIEIILQSLDQSEQAIGQVLDVMYTAMPRPRPNLSKYAPRVKIVKIDPSKIGELIGPGGKVIKSITEESGTDKISIGNDGVIKIYAADEDVCERAYRLILPFSGGVKPGSELLGEVTRIESYGAFVEIPYSKLQGLIHVSNLKLDGKNIYEAIRVGQRIRVIFLGQDEKGRNRFKAA